MRRASTSSARTGCLEARFDKLSANGGAKFAVDCINGGDREAPIERQHQAQSPFGRRQSRALQSVTASNPAPARLPPNRMIQGGSGGASLMPYSGLLCVRHPPANSWSFS